MKLLNVRITGTRPFLSHNDTLSDPLNPLTKYHKALSSKRKKTDEDYALLAESQLVTSCYYDEQLGFVMNGEMIEACIKSGAKLNKLGKVIDRAIMLTDVVFPMTIKNCPANPQELAKNPDFIYAKSVKIGTARVMSYRPIFRDWSVEFGLMFDEEQISKEELLMVLENAGNLCGVGDWRPRFGRFSVEVISEGNV
ncbi:hypothetical protein ESCO50_00062 [Escherichia phage vB_EcoM_ESCO50]|uniref:Uncharacterized protein n=1 Tax=Escherichia phage vB_EcoM_ESCO50 TaxID=2918872 RepID=A0AAE9HQB9_9CAUD|nr:hypothetical protein ESCO50_00062 [Escherichia phage vB_EcoM_ESCO50]